MAVNSDVTAEDIRTELNELPAEVVSDSVIKQQIDHAEVIVGATARDDVDDRAIEMAVTIVAAHSTLATDDGGWTTVAQELDVREEYDVAGMVSELRARRAEALALVAPNAGGPSLHALGDRYRDPPSYRH